MTARTQEASVVRFAPRRIGHANLFVGELERSMHFYNKVCGFEEVFREPHITAGFLSNGNTHHDLGLIEVTDRPLVGRDGHVQVAKGRGLKAGLNHFGWEMENEESLVNAYNRAIDAGLDIHRTVDHQTAHSIYMFDPDGNLHEFYADNIKEWRSIFTGTAGEAITGAWDPNASAPSTESKYHDDWELRRVDEALIHPMRFTHAVLMTRDFERMANFFTDVAGLDVVNLSPDRGLVCLAGAKANHACDVALFRQAPGSANWVHHYGYQMPGENELEAADAALVAAGIEIEMRLDNATKRSIFITDPDDMRCEFYVARDPDLASLSSATDELRPYLV